VSDIDTAAVDSLKALDPKRPIREATKFCDAAKCREGPTSDITLKPAASNGDQGKSL
jgi:hypothetical protein